LSRREDILAAMARLASEARALGDAELIASMRALLAEQAVAPAAAGAPDAAAWQGMVGRCPPLLRMQAAVEKFAPTDMPVLVVGESGTGKELVAKAVHALSPRRAAPFVSENCAAIPATLLESVLFGHVRGAFTGAVKDHRGHFLAADKGTLFLDEIGDMPLAMQAKLLRALQEGEVRPVGSSQVRRVDVRVVAATNRDLQAMVDAGSFREDLFYRLNVLVVQLPPLRERGEDVLLLARRFLAEVSEGRRGPPLHFDPDAEQALLRARWPGNIRQLRNEVQRLAALCDGPAIRAKDLSAEVLRDDGADGRPAR
jgi:transcriptional regulator with GAF, ATPase, and Fis domain